MKEPIEKALKLGGTELRFSTFAVKAFYGFDLVRFVDDFSSPNSAYRKDAIFQIDVREVSKRTFTIGDIFTLKDNYFTYTFKLTNNPEPDFTGWAKLQASYTGKTAL